VAEFSADSILLPYQKRWLAETARVAVMEKSRRTGISWDTALLCVLVAAAAEDSTNCFYLSYNKDMTRQFIEDAAWWASKLQIACGAVQEVMILDDDEDKHVLTYEIRFDSGRKIQALPSKATSLRSKQGLVVIDEAAFVGDLKEILKAAMALLMWGGRVLIISTHNGVDNQFNELVQDIRAGRKPYALHRVTFDDALAEGLYRRICQKMGKEWSPEAEAIYRDETLRAYGSAADEELHCIPASGSGRWLLRSVVEARANGGPALRFTGAKGMELWPEDQIQAEVSQWFEAEVRPLLETIPLCMYSSVGGDFARVGDLSVFAPMLTMADLSRHTPFTLELANMPHVAQRMILFSLCDALPTLTHVMMDATGNGSYLAEVAAQRYGDERVTRVAITEGWYRDHTAAFAAAVSEGSIVLPKDANTVADLCSFRLHKGVPRPPEKSTMDATGQQRHGDAGIALIMAYEASRKDWQDRPEYSSVLDRPQRNFMAADVDEDETEQAALGVW